MAGLEVHATHTAATAAAAHGRRLLLRMVGDHRFGGDEKGRDGRRVLQRYAYDLGRIDDAGLDEIDIAFHLSIEAIGARFLLEQFADDDRSFHTGVLDDLP